MNIFVVIREILYNFIVTIIYVFLTTVRFPQDIEQLQKNGLETHDAADGLEGIKIFRKTKPDLLLCDMRMPDTDGIEVLKVVKNESPLTPIIMIS